MKNKNVISLILILTILLPWFNPILVRGESVEGAVDTKDERYELDEISEGLGSGQVKVSQPGENVEEGSLDEFTEEELVEDHVSNTSRENSDFEYEDYNGGIKITGYTGSYDGDITIPDKFGDKKLLKIGEGKSIFQDNAKLEGDLIIQGEGYHIADKAFSNIEVEGGIIFNADNSEGYNESPGLGANLFEASKMGYLDIPNGFAPKNDSTLNKIQKDLVIYVKNGLEDSMIKAINGKNILLVTSPGITEIKAKGFLGLKAGGLVLGENVTILRPKSLKVDPETPLFFMTSQEIEIMGEDESSLGLGEEVLRDTLNLSSSEIYFAGATSLFRACYEINSNVSTLLNGEIKAGKILQLEPNRSRGKDLPMKFYSPVLNAGYDMSILSRLYKSPKLVLDRISMGKTLENDKGDLRLQPKKSIYSYNFFTLELGDTSEDSKKIYYQVFEEKDRIILDFDSKEAIELEGNFIFYPSFLVDLENNYSLDKFASKSVGNYGLNKLESDIYLKFTGLQGEELRVESIHYLDNEILDGPIEFKYDYNPEKFFKTNPSIEVYNHFMDIGDLDIDYLLTESDLDRLIYDHRDKEQEIETLKGLVFSYCDQEITQKESGYLKERLKNYLDITLEENITEEEGAKIGEALDNFFEEYKDKLYEQGPIFSPKYKELEYEIFPNIYFELLKNNKDSDFDLIKRDEFISNTLIFKRRIEHQRKLQSYRNGDSQSLEDLIKIEIVRFKEYISSLEESLEKEPENIEVYTKEIKKMKENIVESEKLIALLKNMNDIGERKLIGYIKGDHLVLNRFNKIRGEYDLYDDELKNKLEEVGVELKFIGENEDLFLENNYLELFKRPETHFVYLYENPVAKYEIHFIGTDGEEVKTSITGRKEVGLKLDELRKIINDNKIIDSYKYKNTYRKGIGLEKHIIEDKDIDDVIVLKDETENIFYLQYKKETGETPEPEKPDPGKPIDPKPEPEPEPEPEELGLPEGPETPKLNKEDHFQYIQGYPDETIRPKDNITREEVAAVFFRLLDPEYRETIRSSSHDYPDFNKDRWSAKHIGTLSKGNILEGYEDGEFKPRKTITRAEVATIASRFDDLEELKTSKFSDVSGHWAEKYIDSATEKGWIKGYPDGSFKPDQPITRAEFVTLVNNVLERKVNKENILDGIKLYSDLKEDTWYYEAMVEAINSHDYGEERLKDRSEVWLRLTYPDIEM